MDSIYTILHTWHKKRTTRLPFTSDHPALSGVTTFAAYIIIEKNGAGLDWGCMMGVGFEIT